MDYRQEADRQARSAQAMAGRQCRPFDLTPRQKPDALMREFSGDF